MGSTYTRSAVALMFSVVVSAVALADSARFDIAAQPLPAALKVFASQANMRVLYQYDSISGLRGNPVKGELETHAALQELLKDTGLVVVYTSDSAATIRRQGERSGIIGDSVGKEPGVKVAASEPVQAGQPAQPNSQGESID